MVMDFSLIRVYSQEDLQTAGPSVKGAQPVEISSLLKESYFIDMDKKHFGVNPPIKRAISDSSSDDSIPIRPLKQTTVFKTIKNCPIFSAKIVSPKDKQPFPVSINRTVRNNYCSKSPENELNYFSPKSNVVRNMPWAKVNNYSTPKKIVVRNIQPINVPPVTPGDEEWGTEGQSPINTYSPPNCSLNSTVIGNMHKRNVPSLSPQYGECRTPINDGKQNMWTKLPYASPPPQEEEWGVENKSSSCFQLEKRDDLINTSDEYYSDQKSWNNSRVSTDTSCENNPNCYSFKQSTTLQRRTLDPNDNWSIRKQHDSERNSYKSWNRKARRSLPTCQNQKPQTINMKESRIIDCSAGTGFIDTHCHLDFIFKKIHFNGNFAAFVRNCEYKEKFPANFEGCVAIFCEPVTFKKKAFWEKMMGNSFVWGSFGCHPHFADTFDKEAENVMRYALGNKKSVALGEMGLDYSYKNNVPRELQKSVLRNQINMAIALKKPIVIHCRDAHYDCLSICRKCIPHDYPIHRHCFTETWSDAQEWMTAFPKLKFGFTCLILNPKVQELRTVVRDLPLDKILLETDAPYFKPKCVQNMICAHPGMAIYVAEEIADIKGANLNDVLIQVRKNTREIYSI